MLSSIIFNNLFLKRFGNVCFPFLLLGWFALNSIQAQTPITTVAGLKTMSMAGNYILSNDLDLSSETNWTPIGTSGAPFTGTFDGNGKVIKGLQINRPTTDNVGLFGYCKDATIKNLGIEVASGVVGADNVGGLIGKYEKASVTNGISGCYVTGIGSIRGTGTVGGLVGWSNTTVTNCYATVNVMGYATGGLVGLNYAGTVSYCYASGTVSGPYVGGVVGNNTDYSSSVKASITNCVANNPALSG